MNQISNRDDFSPTITETTSALTSIHRPRHSYVMSRMLLFGAMWLGQQAQAAIYCVDPAATSVGTGTCWSAPFQKLEEALTAAAANPGADEIWLREGVYVPQAPQSGDRRLGHFALVDGVSIYGGFAGTESSRSERNPDAASNNTVLSGDVEGNDGPNFANRDDNVNTILRMNTALATATIDGVTVRGGNAAVIGGVVANAYGGGLSIRRGVVHLRGVHFVENDAINAGGAVALDAQSFSDGVTITQCEFRGNRVTQDFDSFGGGGAVWLNTVYPVAITHSRFLGNQCAFPGCRGAAIRMRIMNQSPRGLIAQSVFSGNVVPEPGANGGGALWVDGFGAEIVHTTFSENYDGAQLQAMRLLDSGLVDIRNSIIDGGLSKSGTGTLGIAYSLINRCNSVSPAPGPGLPSDCGAQDNGGNLRASLDFVDALGVDLVAGTADDDLRLAIGAAAIDRGSNTLIGIDSNDIDGDGIRNETMPLDLAQSARRSDTHGQPDAGNGSAPVVDLGAYETIGATLAFVSATSLAMEGPNAFANAVLRVTTPNGAPLDSPVSAVATSVDGTAVSLTQYVGGVQSLVFGTGTPSGSTQNVLYSLIDDNTPQPLLNFQVRLSAPSNAALLDPITNTVSIVDNDGVSILDASALSGEVLNIPVSLPAPAIAKILVTYTLTGLTAIPGVHFNASVMPVLIPAGETSGTIAIQTFPTADGQTRALRVTLTSASGLTLAGPTAIGSIFSPVDAVFGNGFE